MISQRGILRARSHLDLYPPYGISFCLSCFNSSKSRFVKPHLSLVKHAEPSWHKLQMTRMMSKGSFQNVVSVSQPNFSVSGEYSRTVPGLIGEGIHGLESETEKLDRKPKVIVISGPTASGKTRLGLLLAEKLGGEIISADSVQVYRGLDIGSAKSPLNERQGIPHHLLDIMEPTEEYTAGDFFLHAREATSDVLRRGRVPIVVGGTGLYLRWFLYGKPDTPRATPEVVASVEKEVQMAIEGSEDPWTAALGLLTRVGDITTGQQLSRNDWYRLKRALEIVQMSGRPRSGFVVPSAMALSPPSNNYSGNGQHSLTPKPEGSTEVVAGDWPRTQASESVQEGFQSSDSNSSKEEAISGPFSNLDYDFRCFFLCPPRMDLYRRIDQRCEDMVADGLLQEAAFLLDKGVSANSNPPSRAIGYRQAMEYLEECRERDDHPSADRFLQFLSTFQQASRNYAKRQMVWFRSEQLYRWLDASHEPEDLGAAVIEDYGHDREHEDNNKNFQNHEEATKKRSYKEGKLMKTYRPELKIFSSKERVDGILNQVHDITCRARSF